MNVDTFIDEWIADSDVCLEGMSEAEKASMRPVLMCLCDDLLYYKDLRADIRENGLIEETPKGRRPNPAENMRHKCVARILNECTKLRQAASKAGIAHIDKLAAYVAR